jgi:hypothetical protein
MTQIPQSALNMEAAACSETSLIIYQVTTPHTPDLDLILQDNIKA